MKRVVRGCFSATIMASPPPTTIQWRAGGPAQKPDLILFAQRLGV
jgi:hypothetical protein